MSACGGACGLHGSGSIRVASGCARRLSDAVARATLRPMTRAALMILLASMLAAAPASAQVADSSGADIYAKHCASCHDQGSPRIPPRDALAKMSPARILRTLDFGLMMSVAYPLRRDEREAVAGFLGKGPDEIAPPAHAMCKAGRALGAVVSMNVIAAACFWLASKWAEPTIADHAPASTTAPA